MRRRMGDREEVGRQVGYDVHVVPRVCTTYITSAGPNELTRNNMQQVQELQESNAQLVETLNETTLELAKLKDESVWDSHGNEGLVSM